MRSITELTTKSRIRESAIKTFARGGFRATTVRQIASGAEVSPALVIHYFGSKQGLIQDCDSYITTLFEAQVAELEQDPSGEKVLHLWQQSAEYRPLMAYIVTAIHQNTPFARAFVANSVALTERYLRQASKAGLVRAARDESRRAELIVLIKLGMYALGGLLLPEDTDPEDAPNLITQRLAEEAMDLFTEPTFWKTTYLQPLRDAITTPAGQPS